MFVLDADTSLSLFHLHNMRRNRVWAFTYRRRFARTVEALSWAKWEPVLYFYGKELMVEPGSPITVRGSGRTSRRILGAPKGAIYIWCNSGVWYPTKLAVHLKREDLKIISFGKATSPGYFDGRDDPVVIDHAWLEVGHSPLDIQRMFDVLRMIQARHA